MRRSGNQRKHRRIQATKKAAAYNARMKCKPSSHPLPPQDKAVVSAWGALSEIANRAGFLLTYNRERVPNVGKKLWRLRIKAHQGGETVGEWTPSAGVGIVHGRHLQLPDARHFLTALSQQRRLDAIQT